LFFNAITLYGKLANSAKWELGANTIIVGRKNKFSGFFMSFLPNASPACKNYDECQMSRQVLF
jgi:hypothetical protein